MTARIAVFLLALSAAVSGWSLVAAAQAPLPPAVGVTPAPSPPIEPTPARISYIFGQVSFWRPGAEAWAPAKLNVPLSPGDALYTGPDGTAEMQVGPQAFVRAAAGTQIGVDTQDPEYLQLRVTVGYAAIDLRGLPTGHSVELDTPNAAFTIDRPGYYRVDVDPSSSAFAAYRGGTATMVLPSGSATRIAPDQQVVISGTDGATLALGATPTLTAWDRWGYQRSDYLLQPASQAYVAPTIYGAEALDRHGNWRTVESYGTVWVPAGVATGWTPYSTGRWIWDPRFGWTWLDDAPWGWAPYHYGRWVFVGGIWAWAPGPVVVRPVYAPALVVFLGGVAVSAGGPLYWAPLAWGEPVVPWWGRPGFIGVPWWGGWGGPRVVNNVIITSTTTVNVTNITVYRNMGVINAVVGVPAGHFGRGHVQIMPVSPANVRLLAPVSGPVGIQPVPASLAPATGLAPAPPASVQTRPVVTMRSPPTVMPAPPQHGPTGGSAPSPKPVVTPPTPAIVPLNQGSVRPPGPVRSTPTVKGPGPGPQKSGEIQPPSSQAPPGSQRVPPPRLDNSGPGPGAAPLPHTKYSTPPPPPAERPTRTPFPRHDPAPLGERPDRK